MSLTGLIADDHARFRELARTLLEAARAQRPQGRSWRASGAVAFVPKAELAAASPAALFDGRA